MYLIQERLVLLRVFMEKIKPLDKKLKYQIDKIVKLGSRSNNERTDGVAEMAEDDALNFRPNPEALRPKVQKIFFVYTRSMIEQIAIFLSTSFKKYTFKGLVEIIGLLVIFMTTI